MEFLENKNALRAKDAQLAEMKLLLSRPLARVDCAFAQSFFMEKILPIVYIYNIKICSEMRK